MQYYKLDDNGVPVECDDLIEWARWFETADRRVALTHVTPWIEVSTVFLGIDHRWIGDGPPILYETMVFAPLPGRLTDQPVVTKRFGRGPPRPVYDQTLEEQHRYATLAEARLGHARTVKRLRARVREIDKLQRARTAAHD